MWDTGPLKRTQFLKFKESALLTATFTTNFEILVHPHINDFRSDLSNANFDDIKMKAQEERK